VQAGNTDFFTAVLIAQQIGEWDQGQRPSKLMALVDMTQKFAAEYDRSAFYAKVMGTSSSLISGIANYLGMSLSTQGSGQETLNETANDTDQISYLMTLAHAFVQAGIFGAEQLEKLSYSQLMVLSGTLVAGGHAVNRYFDGKRNSKDVMFLGRMVWDDLLVETLTVHDYFMGDNSPRKRSPMSTYLQRNAQLKRLWDQLTVIQNTSAASNGTMTNETLAQLLTSPLLIARATAAFRETPRLCHGIASYMTILSRLIYGSQVRADIRDYKILRIHVMLVINRLVLQARYVDDGQGDDLTRREKVRYGQNAQRALADLSLGLMAAIYQKLSLENGCADNHGLFMNVRTQPENMEDILSQNPNFDVSCLSLANYYFFLRRLTGVPELAGIMVEAKLTLRRTYEKLINKVHEKNPTISLDTLAGVDQTMLEGIGIMTPPSSAVEEDEEGAEGFEGLAGPNGANGDMEGGGGDYVYLDVRNHGDTDIERRLLDEDLDERQKRADQLLDFLIPDTLVKRTTFKRPRLE
jgi:hypothetical protein